MTTAQDTMQTVDEVTAIIALVLPSTDERRTVWSALSADDQAVVVAQASADLNMVAWAGTPSSRSQAHAFPRQDRCGSLILPEGEMDLPTGFDEWSVASIPVGIRRAHAVQSARRAIEARAMSRARQTRDDAHAGITGRSGLGSGVTLDAERVRSPLSVLDPDAARFADRYIRRTAGLS